MTTRMVRTVCGSRGGEPAVRKGPWTLEEDLFLVSYITQHGEGSWDSLARAAGLNRNGKSCRLRWLNYLRPGVRRGCITPAEDAVIRELHAMFGNKWSKIAKHLPGRTDNEIKNYFRTRIQKKPAAETPKQSYRAPTTTSMAVVSQDASSSSGSASQDSSAGAGDWWYMQPKPEEQAYCEEAVAAATGMVRSEDVSSALTSRDSTTAGDWWFVQPKPESQAYCEKAMAAATGMVKSEGASSALTGRENSTAGEWYTQANYSEHISAADHLGTLGVDALTAQFLSSSEFTDSFWNAVNNFWEATPVASTF